MSGLDAMVHEPLQDLPAEQVMVSRTFLSLRFPGHVPEVSNLVPIEKIHFTAIASLLALKETLPSIPSIPLLQTEFTEFCRSHQERQNGPPQNNDAHLISKFSKRSFICMLKKPTFL